MYLVKNNILIDGSIFYSTHVARTKKGELLNYFGKTCFREYRSHEVFFSWGCVILIQNSASILKIKFYCLPFEI